MGITRISAIYNGCCCNDGYLQIVKYVHDNREECCTTNAIDDAAFKAPFILLSNLIQKNDLKDECTELLDMAI
ncbi:hypothetical protein THRCLA_20657 [Thraustotheca clavata]|uniref:Uncharacterized protein n=1 Tax=Thraustotheca clavata TaxID=74557 RepID=A0A1W0A4U6_9STRA|nr:hypothetical protein THRCLA_20657 [Thraustotheca clavata]